MKYLRKEIEYKSWHITLVLAVLFVALVLGIVQKLDSTDTSDTLISEPQQQTHAIVESVCEDSEGEWESCGSLCRGEVVVGVDNIVCAEVCVEYCYCRDDGQCPEDHHCSEFINETGICVLDF